MIGPTAQDHNNRKARWKILLRSAQNRVERLAKLDFDSDEAMCTVLEIEDSPGHLIAELQEVLTDLGELLKRRKRKRIKAQKSAQDADRLPSPIVRRLLPEGNSDGLCNTNLPQPEILKSLELLDSQVKNLEVKISQLNSRTTAKVHRSLLEERDILMVKRERKRAEAEKLADLVRVHDLTTIASPNVLSAELISILRLSDDKQSFRNYFHNVLCHSVILAIIEATFQKDKRSVKISTLVNYILDLRSSGAGSDSSEDGLTLKMMLDGIFESRSLIRLPIAVLLDDTTTRNRFENRHHTSTNDARPSRSVKSSDMSSLGLGKVNYWILTRTPVTNEELMIDSFALVPRTAGELSDSAQSLSSEDTPTTVEDSTRDEAVAAHIIEGRDDQHSVGHTGDSGNHDDQDGQEYDFEFPSVPTTALAHREKTDIEEANKDEEVDEVEAQRLITLFASSPSSRSDDDEDEDDARMAGSDQEPDYSELLDLTPAEQEEVLKALATAREHHNHQHGLDKQVSGCEESIDELVESARRAMADFNVVPHNESASASAGSTSREDLKGVRDVQEHNPATRSMEGARSPSFGPDDRSEERRIDQTDEEE